MRYRQDDPACPAIAVALVLQNKVGRLGQQQTLTPPQREALSCDA